MLSYDVLFGSECCKSVTVFKSCGSSGECANVLLTRRAAGEEVQYDARTKPQRRRVNVATIREWDKWNDFGVTMFFVQEVAKNDIMKRNPDQKIVGTRWVLTERRSSRASKTTWPD